MLSKNFKPGFKPAKCKTSLKLAVSRIKLLRNKRDIQIKQMRRELALLIENGQEQTARIRVEHVIREEKTSAAYELIELFCELLAARISIIESQRHCPVDLKEAVATVIFASPRCSDIPELMEIRKHFAAKYGKEFTNAALEIRPDCGVSRLVIEKLSARAPDIETKIKTLKAIAEDHNVKWDSESFEDVLQKPHEDLLNGPTSFAGATKYHTEQHTVNPYPAPYPAPYPTQTNASSFNIPQTPNESRTPGAEVNYSKSGNADSSSRNQTAYNMEFQNATSAAQAAAESAERASMAARAAARFANHENMSRQASPLSNETPKYDSKYEKPENLRVFLDGYNSFKEPPAPVNHEQKSKQEVKPEIQNPYMHEQIQRNPSNHFPSNSIPAPSMNYEQKSSQETKPKGQNLHVHEHVQRDPSSHFSSNSSPAPSMNYEMKHSNEVDPRGQNSHVHEHIRRDPSNYFSANSSLDFVDDDMLNSNFRKGDSNNVYIDSKSSGPKSEDPSSRTSKYDNTSIKHADDDYSSTKESFYSVAKDKDVLNSDIIDHEKNEQAFRRGASSKQSSFSDSPAVVFDDYIDERGSSSVWGNNETLFDNLPEEQLSNYHSNTSFTDKTSAESIAKPSSSRLHLFTEPSEEEHSLPSPANVSPIPAFDASDEESTASPVSFSRKSSIKSSYSDDKNSIPNQIYEGETKEATKSDSRLYERKIEADPVMVNKYNFSSSDEEEPLPPPVTKMLPKEKPKSLQSAENLSEEKQGINFGLLTGGLKHKSLPIPPYVKSYASSTSDSPIAKEHESSPRAHASKTKYSYLDTLESDDDEHLPSLAQQKKVYKERESSSRAHASKTKYSYLDSLESDDDEHLQSLAQQKKVYKEINSSPLRAYSDSDDDDKQYPPNTDSRKYNTSSRVNANVKHSRRTRDVLPATQSKQEQPVFEESSKPKKVQTAYEESSKSLSVESVKSTGSVSSEGSKDSRRIRDVLPATQSKPEQPIFEESSKSKQVQTTYEESAKSLPMESVKSTGSVSSEGSVKRASHIHPKLPPDYDTFAARFHALRSNKR